MMPKLNVAINVAGNGCLVVVKTGSKCLGAKVFLGNSKETVQEYTEWVESFKKEQVR